uniref:Cullin-2 n=1 Tax=Phallusia mammillata TaxID=59560 RepID=A0A6F9DB00_9ASCI|nr:cullin-2 [Phallusia mammillata]
MFRHVDFAATWGRLSETVKKVISAQPLERTVWNERFSDVYSICIGNPETLNEKLYEETKNLLCGHVNELYENVPTADGELLSTYSKYWLTYSKGATYLDLLYHHFNTQYVKKSHPYQADFEYGFALDHKEQMLEIGELALECWKNVMIEPLKERLVQHALNEISNDRKGMTSRSHEVNTTVISFVTVEQYKKKSPLQFYETLFEEPFLQQTGDFYRAKANDLLVDSTCSDYMKQVLLLLTEEEMRSRKFLHQSSYKKATLECQQRVIFDHVQFLQAGCRLMIRHDRREDLLHMYMLLKSAPDGLDNMVTELEAHIKEVGLDQIKAMHGANNPMQFVETILDIHRKFYELIHKLFRDDKHFVAALDRACTAIVNFSDAKQPCRAPELVCKYCDTILRKCSKGPTEEADDKLKNSIRVFRYIDDKDVFQKFYSRALAKRLIHSTCVMDMEEQMINRFKDVCGYDFTSKLHCMFTDIRLSAEHTKKFHDSLVQSGDQISPTLNANILQAGAWPLNSTQSNFIPPEALIKCIKRFEEFYSAQYNGRNLTWLQHLSQGEVKMYTATKPYFITLSTYQLAVVLLFNDAVEMTLSDITTSTNLEGVELERCVQSLIESGIILNKEKQKLSPDTVLSFNESFTNKRTRFKISLAPTQREQVAEAQQTRSSVDEDRKLYLQAAIVRVIKARKVLNHNALIEVVITQSRLHFTPSISAIKRSIESLIEKGYIERSADTPDQYRYLA